MHQAHACAASRAAHSRPAQVVALSRGGADIAVKDAMACVFGYGVGVDFTRRDMQARRSGGAWQCVLR